MKSTFTMPRDHNDGQETNEVWLSTSKTVIMVARLKAYLPKTSRKARKATRTSKDLKSVKLLVWFWALLNCLCDLHQSHVERSTEAERMFQPYHAVISSSFSLTSVWRQFIIIPWTGCSSRHGDEQFPPLHHIDGMWLLGHSLQCGPHLDMSLGLLASRGDFLLQRWNHARH